MEGLQNQLKHVKRPSTGDSLDMHREDQMKNAEASVEQAQKGLNSQVKTLQEQPTSFGGIPRGVLMMTGYVCMF